MSFSTLENTWVLETLVYELLKAVARAPQAEDRHRASNLKALRRRCLFDPQRVSAECPRNLFGARSQRHLETLPRVEGES